MVNSILQYFLFRQKYKNILKHKNFFFSLLPDIFFLTLRRFVFIKIIEKFSQK